MARRIGASLRAHPWPSLIGVLALAGAATLAILLLPGHQNSEALDPRTRTYTEQSACLLTDAHGTTSTTAGAAWAGMQRAAKTTAERTSTLPITGTQTLQNAETYLNTLALRGCEVIIGADALPDQAVEARATAYPHTRFITIADTAPAQKETNLTAVLDKEPNTIANTVAAALVTDATRPPARMSRLS
jgi:basic membrane lipoprotein Med (substrate-binding protein (PBP1-ABC) superfamily)